MSEEEYEDQYFDKPMNVAPEMQQAELTRWQLETEDVIELFKHSLRGERWIDTEKNWIEQDGARLLNDKGVEVLAAELRERVNKLSTMSNISADDVFNIVKRFEVNIARLLVMNYDMWAVKNPVYCYTIRDKCVEFVFIGLQRGKDKTFMDFLERAKMSLTQHRVIEDNQHKRRFSPF